MNRLNYQAQSSLSQFSESPSEPCFCCHPPDAVDWAWWTLLAWHLWTPHSASSALGDCQSSLEFSSLSWGQNILAINWAHLIYFSSLSYHAPTLPGIQNLKVYIVLFATAAAKSLQSCPTLCDAIDGSPPSSPIPGILQARTLEWVAISFSNASKWKVKSESEVAQSCLSLSDPMDCSLPGSSVHGIFQARVLEWGAIAFSDYFI